MKLSANSRIRFPRLALVAVIAAGCATQPADRAAQPGTAKLSKEERRAAAALGGQQPVEGRYASQTLADLESSDVEITEGSIDQASIEGALESYKQAVQLFNDPEKRVESLRRMADLTMAASQEKEGVAPAELPVVPAQLTEEEEVKLDREIDEMLFKSFMQGAADAKTQEEKYRMLDLAGGIVPELEGSDLAANYETAILLYQTVIKTSQDPKERAEAYYLLAKAYDISGKHEDSIATLKELGRLYPDSTFYLESQFRLGESYFSDGEFDLAGMAYGEVIRAGDVTPFFQQSVYKRGWSHYKVSDYDKALVDFFALIDLLQKSNATGKDADRNKRLMEDTFRVASMSFNNLDGAKSVTEWFRKNGHRPYEDDIYRSLGEVYVRQERYVDASETFEAYVALYPNSDLAPEFSSASIKALQDGGFPTQVLPAKERFVKAYGIQSAYWKTHEKQRTEYLPFLKSHLLDLAKHHHSTAQKTKSTPSYLTAAGWYQQWLQTDPKDPGAATVNQLYAEALFSGNEFARAVREFERTAYEYPGYDKASEAGYFGLVAYQAQGDEIKSDARREAEYKQLLAKKIDASLKFARTFPAHPKAAYVLQTVVEDQLARKEIAAAVTTAGMLVSLNPPPPNDLLKYGWQTIANGEFDLGRHKVAEFALGKVLAFPDLTPEERRTYSERLAASIYKQGEKLVADGKDLEGAREYLRVGAVVPDATIRATAEFDAAAIYLKKEQWKSAIPVLEQFRTRYPKHELLETIPDKLAVAYEKTGNFGAAAVEMETIHNLNLQKEPELARVALWQAAEFTEKAGNEDGVLRLYGKYTAVYPNPLEPRMEAQYRMLKIFEKRGDARMRDSMLAALSGGARSAGQDAAPRVRYLGAYASFAIAEPAFVRFTEYKLKAPLKASLGEKRKLMQTALDAYATTSRMGVADFASAAQFRTAEVYRILAADLMSSERPRGLDELALEQYDLLLEEQALPFEDQAITLYTQNTELVKQNIYDEWVQKSFKALAVLQPGRFAKKEQTEDYVDIIY
ncbi:MAG: tetratricopeptide repeat protein [Pseudomonadota bacterium]